MLYTLLFGTLIAIGILSLILYRWREIGIMEKTKDDVIEIKNKAEFNAEYEAYNKTLMYGSDVLSCLNKAQNNNQKYVYNNYYGTDLATIGKEDRVEYFIDVEVTIKNPLYDTFSVYYMNKKGQVTKNFNVTDNDNFKTKIFNENEKYSFKQPVINYYYFKNGILIQDKRQYSDIMWDNRRIKAENITLYELALYGQRETKFKADTTYHLLAPDNDNTPVNEQNDIAMLSALISTVNSTVPDAINKNYKNESEDKDWYSVSWKTSAGDFKTRKFKCTGVEYNSNTGYIQAIKFEEI